MTETRTRETVDRLQEIARGLRRQSGWYGRLFTLGILGFLVSAGVYGGQQAPAGLGLFYVALVVLMIRAADGEILRLVTRLVEVLIQEASDRRPTDASANGPLPPRVSRGAEGLDS